MSKFLSSDMPPKKFKKDKIPEVNKLISCVADDFMGDYSCKGVFLVQRKGKPIFHILRGDGTLDSAREIWKEVSTWEYIG